MEPKKKQKQYSENEYMHTEENAAQERRLRIETAKKRVKVMSDVYNGVLKAAEEDINNFNNKRSAMLSRHKEERFYLIRNLQNKKRVDMNSSLKKLEDHNKALLDIEKTLKRMIRERSVIEKEYLNSQTIYRNFLNNPNGPNVHKLKLKQNKNLKKLLGMTRWAKFKKLLYTYKGPVNPLWKKQQQKIFLNTLQ